MKITILCLLLFPFLISGQSIYTGYKPVEKNGKWGFFDDYDNKLVIDYRYDGARQFQGRRAIVKLGDKYGLIDLRGKYIISPTYEDITMLFNQNNEIELKDYYFAKQNDSWGVINEIMETIIPFDYDSLALTVDEQPVWGKFNPKNVQAKALKNGKWGIINFSNVVVVPFKYDDVKNLGKAELYAYEGGNKKSLAKYLGGTNKNSFMEFDYSPNSYWVKKGNKNFVLRNGKKVDIPVGNYNQIIEYTNSEQPLYLVNINGNWGLADEEKLLTAVTYETLSTYFDNVFKFKKQNKYGFLNHKGKVLYPATFSNVLSHVVYITDSLQLNTTSNLIDNSFTKLLLPDSTLKISTLIGGFKVGKKISKHKTLYGLMDEYGELVVPYQYEHIRDFSYDIKNPSNMYVVQKNQAYGIINNKSEEILPVQYEDINNVRVHRPLELVIVKDSITDKYGVLELKTKKWLIEPVNEELIQIEEGYINDITHHDKITYDFAGNKISYGGYEKRDGNVVMKDGKWGVVDDNDEMLIPCQYDEVTPLGEFFVVGKKGFNWTRGLIDSSNNLILPIEYTYIFECKNLLKLSKHPKWAVATKSGELITDFVYDKIHCKYSGDIIEVYQNDKVGALDIHGKNILPVEYKEVKNRGIYIRLFTDGKYGLAHLDGNIILPCQYDDIRLSTTMDLTYIPVRIGNDWIFVNQKGDKVAKRF